MTLNIWHVVDFFQFECVSQAYLNVLFGSKGLKYAKKWSKIGKTENVVTYSTVQNIGLPGLLFRQLLAKKHIRGTKIPPSL